MLTCPEITCKKCPRLFAFRQENKAKFPTYHNAPVGSFGDLSAQLLIIGLAPGLHGANQTGRPFTNDYAGDILYPALKKYGFAQGTYQKKADDCFSLLNTRITNSVRCVPPQNKVTGDEIKNCCCFLKSELQNMPNLKIILTLGAVAHNAVLGALGYKKSQFKFAHGKKHFLDRHNLLLLNSYHTSRYNINTGVLTENMFDKIIADIQQYLCLTSK